MPKRRSSAVAHAAKKLRNWKQWILPDQFSNLYSNTYVGSADARTYAYVAEAFDAADIVQCWRAANRGSLPSVTQPFFMSYAADVTLKSCSTVDQDVVLYKLRARHDIHTSIIAGVPVGNETFANTEAFIRGILAPIQQLAGGASGAASSTNWTSQFTWPLALDIEKMTYVQQFFSMECKRFRLRTGASVMFKIKRPYSYINPLWFNGANGNVAQLNIMHNKWEQWVALVDGGAVYNTGSGPVSGIQSSSQANPGIQIVCRESYGIYYISQAIPAIIDGTSLNVLNVAHVMDERTGQPVAAAQGN